MYKARHWALNLSLAAILLLVSACSAAMIPGTKVEDNAQNRAVFDVVEAYRSAMEERDMSRLSQLVSRRYYENASTTDTSKDDYGFDSLSTSVIPKLRDNIKKVQYRISIRKIGVEGAGAWAEYEYFARFLYSEGGREEWITANDFNRLDLVLEDGAWKIAAGL